MNLFIDRTQFLLLPTVGFVKVENGIWLTIAFLYYGITFHIFKTPGA